MTLKNFLFHNLNPAQTILKNIFWLLSGQTLGRLIRALLIISAARLLGAASFGAFSYALSVAAFLSIFADLGLNAFINREFSRHQNHSPLAATLTAALSLKIIIVLSLIVIIPLLAPSLTNLEEAKPLIVIAVLIFAFDTLRDFGAALCRAFELMQLESVVNIFTNLSIALFGGLALYFYANSSALAWGYALGSGVGALLMFLLLRPHLPTLSFNVSFSQIRQIFVQSLPFSFLAVTGAVMINTDIIILGWLEGPAATGLFAAAEKLIQLLYLLPGIIAAAVFPLLARLNSQPKRFRALLEKSLVAVSLLGLPLSVGGLILSQPLISFLYGSSYLDASSSLAVLSLTLFIVFPSVVAGNALFALNRRRELILFSLLGISGNIILDLILIPSFGILGCALATLINQIILNAYLFLRLKHLTDFTLLPHLRKISAAAGLMASFILIFETAGLPVLLTITAAANLYFLSLYLLHEPALNIIKTTRLS